MPQNATWVTTPELYSTEMRTVGHSTCVAISKFGSFAAPYLVISSASDVTVGIVLCVMNVVGAVAANFLPDTTGRNKMLLLPALSYIYVPAEYVFAFNKI